MLTAKKFFLFLFLSMFFSFDIFWLIQSSSFFKNHHCFCCILFLKKLWPLFMVFNCPKARQPLRGAIFLIPNPQGFLVLICLTLKGWNAESTMDLPSGFELGTPNHSTLATRPFWPFFFFYIFFFIYQVVENRCMFRQYSSVLSQHNRSLYVFLLLFFK